MGFRLLALFAVLALGACAGPQPNQIAPLNPAPSLRYPRTEIGAQQCMDDGLRAVQLYLKNQPLTDQQQVDYVMGIAYVCDRLDPTGGALVKSLAQSFAEKTGANAATLADGAPNSYRASYAIDIRPYDIVMN
jgi:hypothetical protein